MRATTLKLIAIACLCFSTAPAKADEQLNKMIGQMLMMGFQGASANGAGPKRLAAQIRNPSAWRTAANRLIVTQLLHKHRLRGTFETHFI